MSKNFGFELLDRQAVEFLQSELDWVREEALGDSEIEKLFYLAVYARIRLGATEFQTLFVVKDEAAERQLMAAKGPIFDLFVRPQAQVGDWRVDFLFHAWGWNTPKFMRFIVECDGHDFHERTKEQAARDRARDRQAMIDGIPVLRFTGSEIWKNPWGCAEEFLNFAGKDWGRSP